MPNLIKVLETLNTLDQFMRNDPTGRAGLLGLAIKGVQDGDIKPYQAIRIDDQLLGDGNGRITPSDFSHVVD